MSQVSRRRVGMDKPGPPRKGRLLALNGRTVHVLRQGSGPPVLLLHGNGGLGEEILAPFAAHVGVDWIAPDRPGYGYSQTLQSGRIDPMTQARWNIDLIDRLGLSAVHVVAHSIAAGQALCMASRFPHRIRSVTLLAPFCRPTPPRWMPGLRLAVAPVFGGLVRAALVPLVPMFKRRIFSGMAKPHPVPATVSSLPVRHMAKPAAVKTIAAELRAFNAGMARANPKVPETIPVVVMFGGLDRTADPGWHGPWLQKRAGSIEVRSDPMAGHMIHHLSPAKAWDAVRTALSQAASV